MGRKSRARRHTHRWIMRNGELMSRCGRVAPLRNEIETPVSELHLVTCGRCLLYGNYRIRSVGSYKVNEVIETTDAYIRLSSTGGKSFKISPEDFASVSQHYWGASNCHGVNRRTVRGGSVLLLHRVLMSTPDDLKVDHIDGDRMNNMRSNLRVCTQAENRCNNHVKLSRDGKVPTSKYKGVTRCPKVRVVERWVCSVSKSGKCYKLRAKTEIDAAQLYNFLAYELQGEFACVNTLVNGEVKFVTAK